MLWILIFAVCVACAPVAVLQGYARPIGAFGRFGLLRVEDSLVALPVWSFKRLPPAGCELRVVRLLVGLSIQIPKSG